MPLKFTFHPGNCRSTDLRRLRERAEKASSGAPRQPVHEVVRAAELDVLHVGIDDAEEGDGRLRDGSAAGQAQNGQGDGGAASQALEDGGGFARHSWNDPSRGLRS